MSAPPAIPPSGTRGFGPLRASQYTLQYEEYLRDANDHILVALILETKEAVEHVDEIMDVPGIDALFLGLFDLCLAMGLNPLEMPFPQVDDIIERTLEQGKKRGVAIGTATPDELSQRLAQGFTFISYGTDYLLLRNAAKQGLSTFRPD